MLLQVWGRGSWTSIAPTCTQDRSRKNIISTKKWEPSSELGLQGGLTRLPSMQSLRDLAHQQNPGSCFSLLFPIHRAWAAGTQASTPLQTHAWMQKDPSVFPQQTTWSPPSQRLCTTYWRGKREKKKNIYKEEERENRKWENKKNRKNIEEKNKKEKMGEKEKQTEGKRKNDKWIEKKKEKGKKEERENNNKGRPTSLYTQATRA